MSDFTVIPSTETFFIQTIETPNILHIVDNGGDPILSIEQDGTITWHQPGKSAEAAELFVQSLQFNIETKAGIKQGREDWEANIRDKLLSAAEKEPLTPEKLTEVLNKCIMLDKLKGLK